MSWIFRFGSEGSRETLLVTKNGPVFQLRKGNMTFSVKNTKTWPSFSDWALTNAERFIDSIPLDLSRDSKLVLSILLKYNTLTSLEDGTYRKLRQSKLYIMEDGVLAPLFIANDGTMKYKGKIANTLLELNAKPQFWIKLKSGDCVEYYGNNREKTNTMFISNFVENISRYFLKPDLLDEGISNEAINLPNTVEEPVVDPVTSVEPVTNVEPVSNVKPVSTVEPVSIVEPVTSLEPVSIVESITSVEPVLDTVSVSHNDSTPLAESLVKDSTAVSSDSVKIEVPSAEFSNIITEPPTKTADTSCVCSCM